MCDMCNIKLPDRMKRKTSWPKEVELKYQNDFGEKKDLYRA